MNTPVIQTSLRSGGNAEGIRENHGVRSMPSRGKRGCIRGMLLARRPLGHTPGVAVAYPLFCFSLRVHWVRRGSSPFSFG